MDVQNLGDFARFCEKHRETELFPEQLEVIGRVADAALRQSNIWNGGNHNRLHLFLEEAVNTQFGAADPEFIALAEELLTQHWKFGHQAVIFFDRQRSV